MAEHDSVTWLVRRLTAMTLGVLVLTSVLLSVGTLQRFEKLYLPELRVKADAVGVGLVREVERALEYGIPLEDLPGVQKAMEDAVAHHPDIVHVALQRLDGRVMAEHGRPRSEAPELQTSLSLESQGMEVGRLRLSLDPDAGTRASIELMMELGTQMLVSSLVAFELLLLVVFVSIRRSTRRESTDSMPEPTVSPHAGHIILLRLPVFLFCLSEEFSRPMLPAYARGMSDTAPWLHPDLVMGMPVAVFMGFWALSQPLGARWSQAIDPRRMLVPAGLLTAAGLVMSAYADHLLALLVWRCATAIGYGLVLIVAQGAAVRLVPPQSRTRGMAHYIGAVMSAGVCGVAIGGIVADQVGVRATFLMGAVTAVLAALVYVCLIPNGRAAQKQTVQATPVAQLLRNRTFLSIELLSALPIRMAATGILSCLLPVLLVDRGASGAEIGRAQMMYFLAFIVAAPAVSRWADRQRGNPALLLLTGSVITLAVTVLLAWITSPWTAPLAMFFFGVSHSMINAPQIAWVTQVARENGVAEISAIGWHRLVERCGGALGPVILMWISITWSQVHGLVAVGLLCTAAAALLWWTHAKVEAQDHCPSPPKPTGEPADGQQTPRPV